MDPLTQRMFDVLCAIADDEVATSHLALVTDVALAEVIRDAEALGFMETA